MSRKAYQTELGVWDAQLTNTWVEDGWVVVRMDTAVTVEHLTNRARALAARSMAKSGSGFDLLGEAVELTEDCRFVSRDCDVREQHVLSVCEMVANVAVQHRWPTQYHEHRVEEALAALEKVA